MEAKFVCNLKKYRVAQELKESYGRLIMNMLENT